MATRHFLVNSATKAARRIRSQGRAYSRSSVSPATSFSDASPTLSGAVKSTALRSMPVSDRTFLSVLRSPAVCVHQALGPLEDASSQVSRRGFSADAYPPYTLLEMPSMSPTMTQGNVVEWKKKEGEAISGGDSFCSIETDKATLENEAQEEGFLAKILVPAGSKDIPVGTPIAVLVDNEEDASKFSDFTLPSSPASSSSASDSSSSSPPLSPPHSPPTHIGPSVRRLLEESHLDPSFIQGSGPHGYIVKGDVLKAVKEGTVPKVVSASHASPPPSSPAPSAIPATVPASASPSVPPTPAVSSPPPSSPVQLPASQDYVDIPTTQIRRIIAERLLESKWTIPHSYVRAEAIIDATLSLRKELKAKYGLSVSVNDIIVKAVAMALAEVKEANASWDPATERVVQKNEVDISIAVATDKGLITPIVKGANTKSLSSISSEIKQLAEKARMNKLTPEEFIGGSFSVSNLGMFSIDRFTAIINPPQSGILAVGRGDQAVRSSTEFAEDGSEIKVPKTVTKLEISLSADSRVIGTDVAAKLIDTITANLEDPQRMLV